MLQHHEHFRARIHAVDAFAFDGQAVPDEFANAGGFVIEQFGEDGFTCCGKGEAEVAALRFHAGIVTVHARVSKATDAVVRPKQAWLDLAGPGSVLFLLAAGIGPRHHALMKLLLAFLLLATTTARAAENLEQTYGHYGRLIVTQFVSAPFPHPARAEGHKYKDKVYAPDKHYRDSTVAIFIPEGFRETGKVDFVVHFHGWYNTVAGTLSQYQLIEQFVESGKNAVLIVPEGPHDAPDSFGGKLEDPDGFKRFIDEAAVALRRSGALKQDYFVLGDIILSGHSGGYRVISAIVDRLGLAPHVTEVWLFDALYAESDKFLTWWDTHRGRLLNIYTDGGGTKDDSEAMMALLKKRGTAFLAVEETKATANELKTNKLVFLHTDLPHNDVVEKRKEFCLFLKTSCLGETKVR